MILETIDNEDYRLPGNLSPFQREMYVHLIRWKWKKLGNKTRGTSRHKGEPIEYDGILPDSARAGLPHIYEKIVPELKKRRFRRHRHFYHMASSQAANINLFLPVLLLSARADNILRSVKPDIKRVAKIKLEGGFSIEFSDGTPGVLGDKSATAGTDADIAIEYFNLHDEPCLWLIEHKLTEKEFTKCGGAKSKHRVSGKHDCAQNFAALLKNKDACYYHSARGFNYWKLTDAHQAYFSSPGADCVCPFKGGLNQLWRNQLLALGIQHEVAQGYKHVCFSVVHHPGNSALKKSLDAYKTLIGNHTDFSWFTSDRVVAAAEETKDLALIKWAAWYRDLYNLKKVGGAHA